MAKISPYVSGKVKELKVGITSYSEGKTSLSVTGNVGVGTTDPYAAVGVSNTSVLAVGILTANKIFSTGFGQFTGGGVLVDNIVGTALSVSGISTLANVKIADGNVAIGTDDATATVTSDNTSILAVGILTANKIFSTGFGQFTGGSVLVDNISGIGLSISGVSTFGELGSEKVIVGKGSTDLLVTGDARVKGTLKIGDGTITLDSTGISTFPTGVEIGTVSISTTGVSSFPFDVEVGSGITFYSNTGIISATQFIGDGSGLTNLPGISGNIVGTALSISGIASVGAAITMSGATGIISATAFYGDGSNLTGITDLPDNLVGTALSISGIASVGAAITMSGATGIITATAFYGDGSNLSGVGNTENVSTNSLVVSGISTLGHVGIGTTNYNAAVTSENTKKVSVGIVSAYEVYAEKIYGDGTELTLGALSGIATGIGTFIASAGVSTDVDTFAYASLDYKLAEYSFHFINGSNIQAEKLLVMQDNTTAFSNEFAIMSSSDLLVSVGATISGSNVLVQVTPETGISGLTTYRWRREVQE